MRRAPNGRDTTRESPDVVDAPLGEEGDWNARHARTRRLTDGPNVRADDADSDWSRRHGRTRR